MSTTSKININTATLEELTTVSGIGPALAKRIIAKRPFSDLDELTKVPGIGENSVEQLKSNFTLEDVELPRDFQTFVDSIRNETEPEPLPTETPPDVRENLEIEENQEDISRLEKVIETSSEEADENNNYELVKKMPELEYDPDVEIIEPEITSEEKLQDVTKLKDIEMEISEDFEAKAKRPESVTIEKEIEKEEGAQPEIEPESTHTQRPSEDSISRSQLIWSLLGTAIFSIILTILITLGILSATNGGLNYATIDDANRLENQITILNDTTTNMQTNIESINTRLDALEKVAGRVSVLEDRADTIEENIGSIQTSIQEISETITTIQEEIILLQESAQKSEDFRSGLLQLLLDIDGQNQEGKTTP